jgi:hypothetical protein
LLVVSGLSSNPDVIAAGKATLDSHGAGLSSVRFICGTQDIHRQLEKKIAQFHGRDDAILYAACFDANAGIFEVMLSTIFASFTWSFVLWSPLRCGRRGDFGRTEPRFHHRWRSSVQSATSSLQAHGSAGLGENTQGDPE